MKRIFLFVQIFCFLVSLSVTALAQFTRQDTLRGSNGAGREWWDVTEYDLMVSPDYDAKSITGRTVISFDITGKPEMPMQIDLQQPLVIDSMFFNGARINRFSRDGNVYWIDLENKIRVGPVPGGKQDPNKLKIFYHGNPVIARRPPWDGGWIFARDAKGRPWLSVACQGTGASIWYPCKDYQGDEPDSGATITISAPPDLVAVSNGRLTDERSSGSLKQYTWQIKNPINNYNIIPYVGHYVNWKDQYDGEKGKLDCSYWVLDYDLEKAKEQFIQAKMVLEAFEYWFGPYPFYEDGFKLVESPHLGMEHQSAVAYGNRFRNGYLGRDLSGTGWGLKWDFIIVHEVGHEWFGNNITTKDIADMWVHEGFANYSETLFTDYHFGKEAGNEYCIGTRGNIRNDRPIIAPYGVNREGSGDMYYKGGNMLHTIRQLINDDARFRLVLRGLNSTFYHSTVTTRDIEHYMSEKSGIDLSKVFDQYLRTTNIPVLEYKIAGTILSYRWANCVDGFDMKVRLSDGLWLSPTPRWTEIPINVSLLKNGVEADKNFYVTTKRVE